MTINLPDVSRSATAGVTPTTRPTVNPHAALGAVALWLREEGVIPNGTAYTDDSRRRRVGLMRELLLEFGLNSATVAERAAAHAAGQKVAALAGDVR